VLRNKEMTLMKVSDLRLRFEHPVVLNPEKNYKLGVSHLTFSLRQTFFIEDFWFEIKIPIPKTGEYVSITNYITGSFTIKALEKELQNMFNATCNSLLEEMEKEKQTEIVNELKKVRVSPLKFKIKKIHNTYLF
jgi:hypothetical protein